MYDVDSWVKTHGPMRTIRDTLERYNCRLEYKEEVSAEIQQIEGYDYKQHLKRQMAHVMGDAMMKKIKYTAIENPQRLTKTVRAVVYVFTEEELVAFAKEIYHAG